LSRLMKNQLSFSFSLQKDQAKKSSSTFVIPKAT